MNLKIMMCVSTLVLQNIALASYDIENDIEVSKLYLKNYITSKVEEGKTTTTLNLSVKKLDLTPELIEHTEKVLKIPNYIQVLKIDHQNLSMPNDENKIRGLTDAIAQSHLENINFRGNPLDTKGAQILAKALKNSSIKILNLGHITNFKYQRIEGAADFFNNPNLQSINLSKNKLNDEDAEAIADNFKKVENLQYLILDENDFTPKGINAIVQAIQNNKLPNLTFLSLGNSNLEKESLHAIAEMIKTSKTLKGVDLSGTKFDKEEIKIIANALDGSELTYVGLACTSLDSDTILYLAKALKTSKINDLYLAGNDIEDEDFIKLGQILEDKEINVYTFPPCDDDIVKDLAIKFPSVKIIDDGTIPSIQLNKL